MENMAMTCDAASEISRLQGTWRQVACEIDGVENASDEFGAEPVLTITGQSFVVTRANGSVVIKGRFRVDPTCMPKAIDWSDTFGTDAGKTFFAIYALEVDRLVFCAADEGQERPRNFRAGPGQVLRVHQRVGQGCMSMAPE